MKQVTSITRWALTCLLLATLLAMPAAETRAQAITEKEWKEIETELAETCASIFKMMGLEELDDGITVECYSAVSIRFFLKALRKSLPAKVTMEDLNKEAMRKFPEFLTKMMDENDPLHVELFSEVFNECAGNLARARVTGPATARVPLSRFGDMFKIKITIGKSSKYYLLDSGATYCMVSMSYLEELYENGLVDEDSVLEPVRSELADGSVVTVNRVLLHNLVVGPYTLDNVVVGVVENDIGFLCGKNVLNAFRSWKIHNNPPELELTK
jgi:hypothetical protein